MGEEVELGPEEDILQAARVVHENWYTHDVVEEINTGPVSAAPACAQ